MVGHWMVGCVMFWQGQFPEGRRELEEAVALYDPSEQREKTLAAQIDPEVSALIHLGWTLWILGYPEQALRTSEEAIAAARKLAQPFALAQALFWACSTRLCCGQTTATETLGRELRAITTEHKLAYLGACATLLEGQTLIAKGNVKPGLGKIRQAFSEFSTQEAGLGRPWAVSVPVAAFARIGQAEEGMKMLTGAFQAVEANDEHQWEAELHRLKGELLILPPTPNADEAESCFRRAIDIARQQNAKSLELRAVVSLARFLRSAGHQNMEARDIVTAVYDWFTEGLDTEDLKAAKHLLDELAAS